MSQQIDTQLVNDLEQRVQQLQAMDEADFGGFTRVDWLILVITSVILPLIAFALAR